MEEIGIREFKQRANEIVRWVREEQESFFVAYRGKAMAKLVPAVDPSEEHVTASATWTRMDEMSREIDSHRPSGVPEEETINEHLREL